MRSYIVALVLVMSSAYLAAQNNPVPLINQPLVPASAAPGNSGFILTVNGTGFASNAVVEWNGSTRVTLAISNSSLQAVLDASDVAKPGTAAVTVVNPAPGGGTSNAVYFPVRASSSGVATVLDRALNAQGATALGDFNHDGKLDVAIGNGNLIQIFLGNDRGGFQTPIEITWVYFATYMLAADFDNDGNLDLLVSDNDFNHLYHSTVFRGHGDGTFTQGAFFSGYIEGSGDWNGDGNVDVIMGESDRSTEWSSALLGNGDGTFTVSQPSISSNFGGVTVGDFNGDGKLDLTFYGGYVALGNGDGTFKSPVNTQPPYQGDVAIVDINGDGKLDMITSGFAVMLGKGDGTFTKGFSTNLGVGPGRITVGDLNGDGKLDAAVSLYDTSKNTFSLAILMGNGDGTFQPPLTIPIGRVNFSNLGSGLAMADFNQDGMLDILLAGGQTTKLFLQSSVALVPLGITFGQQTVGITSAPQTATVTNLGTSTLNIQSISISGTNASDFAQTNNCGSSLGVGASCSIQATFTPSQLSGRSAVLTVNTQGQIAPQTATLSGTGVPGPTALLRPVGFIFPVQLINTESPSQAATLSNVGTLAVTISKISTDGPFTQTNNCPASLAGGASCQNQVQFAPTVGGSATGTLSVTDNASDSPQTAQLSGTGTVVLLSVTGVNFGDQKVGTTSNPAPITLTNKGSGPLMINQIAIGGTNAGDFTEATNCSGIMPAGASCTIRATFTPTATGLRSGTLVITDDGGGSPQTVPLSGTGT